MTDRGLHLAFIGLIVALALALPCAQARAAACRIIRFEWACASGPVDSYEVVVGTRYVGSVSGCGAYLGFPLSPVTVRAVDATGAPGPWSEESVPLGIPDFAGLARSYPR